MKLLRITLEGKSYEVGVEVLDDPASVSSPISVPAQVVTPDFLSRSAVAHADPPHASSSPVAAGGLKQVPSPMAGQVFKCPVKAGDRVTQNQVLIVLDAMKMETPVCSPLAGTVRAVLVKEGDAVDEGDLLVQIEG